MALLRSLSLLLGLLGGFSAAFAENLNRKLLSAEEFEAYTSGKTLTFSQFGRRYGMEQYLPDRAVRWGVAGELCAEGHWYGEGEFICFTYSHSPTSQCWRFWQQDGKLHGLFNGDPTSAALVETDRTVEPLSCQGPEVGV